MPEISIIMPVYNSEAYLREAIDSMLAQTFRDFELLLINDGSTDSSETIILSYQDPRIVYVKNASNIGLIATLNKGISLAKGNYIARMDGDDISHKERLELQLAYFKREPSAGVVCSPIMGITPAGRKSGTWPADFETRTSKEIASRLSWENCIAHPTVMIRKELLARYHYKVDQKSSEDWDLWLRLTRDKIRIVKTDEILVDYRIHPASTTQQHNRLESPQVKAAKVKWRFFASSLRQSRINFFVLKTLFTSYKDLGYYFKSIVLPGFLRRVKWLLTIDPFAARRQFLQLEQVLSGQGRHFLFFPYAHLGGAEKVHAEITKVLTREKPFVFFTGLANEANYLEQFGTTAHLLMIEKALYHPFFSARSRKIIRDKIKATSNAVVFGCNNRFFYELIPSMPHDTWIVDLTHDYDYIKDKGFAEQFLPSFLRCNRRVFISHAAVKKTLDFYETNFVDEEYRERITIIYNYVDPPLAAPGKDFNKPYKVLYAGRDTAEKRVGLLFELAAQCADKGLPFEFIFVGPLQQRNNYGHLRNVKTVGLIRDEAVLSKFYASSHLVAIASSSEGFPLSLAEGMRHGSVPLSTSVGDIPFHIKQNETGFLVTASDEQEVVRQMLDTLSRIALGEIALAPMSEKCAAYAKVKFDKAVFESAYKELLRADQASQVE